MRRSQNLDWHRENPQPDAQALHEHRMKWHLEHSKNCGCYSSTVAAAIRRDPQSTSYPESRSAGY
jgi:hypothetical protein